MTRLSLCMIVRDERAQLDACLDSVAAAVDEIVIADTGSCDGTFDRVRDRADHALRVVWHDDFSEARNAALDRASGDWVLVLDADERLAPDAIPALRAAIEDDRALAWRLRVRSDVGEGRSEEAHIVRLFRRHPALRFTGCIHEQVTPALRTLMDAEPRWRVRPLAGVCIDHTGYRPDVSRKRGKRRRNLRLLRRALGESPEDPYLLYKLSQALRTDADDPAAAAREAAVPLARAAEILLAAEPAEIARQHLAGEILTAAAQHWLTQDDDTRARDACQAALSHSGEHPATRLVLGHALLAGGSPGEAVREIERALFAPPSPDRFHYDTAGHDAAGRLLLAEARSRCGDAGGARNTLAEARQAHPDDPRLAHRWIRLLLDSGDDALALRDGVQWLSGHPRDPEALRLCADAAERLGHTEHAARWRAALGH